MLSSYIHSIPFNCFLLLLLTVTKYSGDWLIGLDWLSACASLDVDGLCMFVKATDLITELSVLCVFPPNYIQYVFSAVVIFDNYAAYTFLRI